MSWRALVVGGATLLLAFSAGAASAATPEGPREAISVYTDGPGGEDEGSEVITAGAMGESPRRLAGGRGTLLGDALSWSADGSRITFGISGVDSTAAGAFGTGWQVVGVAGIAGGPTRAFPRAFLNAGDPVMAPDGRSVAFQRVKAVRTPPGADSPLLKSSLWLLDVEDGSVRRLTRWRFGSFLDPISYSSDGSALLAVRLDYRAHRIVAVDLHSRRSRALASLRRDDSEPTYSPDGSMLAFVRLRYLSNPNLLPARPVSELLVARADGSRARSILRRKGYITSPSWDPSGSRLAFTRDPVGEATGMLEPELGNKVMAINADGTCLTKVFSDPEAAVSGVAWQPGPGREAGPLAC